MNAGLVATPSDWPGVMLLPKERAYAESVARPKAYFGDGSTNPAVVELITADAAALPRLRIARVK